jgi:hypothetical protein
MERNAQIPGQFSVSANTQRKAAAGYLLTGVGIREDNVLTLCLSNDMPDALVHAGTLF